MGKKWMTGDTQVVVSVRIIDEYERKIVQLHRALNDAKAAKEPAGKVMLVESKVGRPVNEMEMGKAPAEQEYRIEHCFVSGASRGTVIIRAANEAEAMRKFFQTKCSIKVLSASAMPDMAAVRSDFRKLAREHAELKAKLDELA